MLRRFLVTPELQQFLMGVSSGALTNVTWDRSFPSDSAVLPLSPSSVRRSLLYSHLDRTMATPGEFDVFIENLDGSASVQITRPR